MQKKILIAGYYGFGNLGDEAILATILRGISELPIEPTITVVSGNPEETKKRHKVAAILWKDLDAIIQVIEETDLVLLGGGGLFQETWDVDWSCILTNGHVGIPFYASFPILAKAAGKPCIILSTGVGPLKTAEAKTLTRIAFENADIATVRDQDSLDRLTALGVSNPSIYISADPGFNLLVDTEEADRILIENWPGDQMDAPLVGISVRYWDLGPPPDEWQREFAQALDRFLEEIGGIGIFIPFQVGENPLINDSMAAQNIIAHMKLSGQTRIICQQDGKPYEPEVVAGLFAHCELVLGMRLHSVILAVRTCTPMVGISYDPKVRSHMQRLGLEEYLLDLDVLEASTLSRVLVHAWDSRQQTKESLEQVTKDLKTQVDKNFRFVLDLLRDGYSTKSFNDHSFLARIAVKQTKLLSRTEQNLREQRLIVERLQGEKAEAELNLQSAQAQSAEWHRQLEEIRTSNSWKLVSMLGGLKLKLAPPGSSRARFFGRIIRLVINIREQGWRGMLRGFTNRTDTAEPDWRSTLDALLAQHEGKVKEIIVFPPGVEWDLPLFQRPQQMALAFARLGSLVLYCEPEYSKSARGIHKIEDRLYRCNVPLTILDDIENLVAIVFTYNKNFLSSLRKPRVVYEYIDDLDVFPYDQAELKRNHAELCRSATVVVATAERLWEEVQQVRPDAILCPNGVDYGHFLPAREPGHSPPTDLAPILDRGKPVVGYYGALARWFDYDLLAQVATRRSDLSFLLIGPDYDGTLPQSGLLDHPNVNWLGVRPYTELPHYLAYFDVATIPFKMNDITHATSPLKLFEYMAGRKPVVVTAMHESGRLEGVLTASTAEKFISQIDQALDLRNSPDYVAMIDRVARENTWDARAELILKTLAEKNR